MDVRIRNANTFKSVMEIEEEALHCLFKGFERLPREWQEAIVREEEPLRPEIEPDFLGHGKDE